VLLLDFGTELLFNNLHKGVKCERLITCRAANEIPEEITKASILSRVLVTIDGVWIAE
jgi:hypothetical protein